MIKAYATDAQLVKVIDMTLEGKTVCDMMAATGLPKSAVVHWRKESLLAFKANDCGCGRPVGHTGQCSVKHEKRKIGSNWMLPQVPRKIVVLTPPPKKEEPAPSFKDNDDFVPAKAGRPYRLVKAGLA